MNIVVQASSEAVLGVCGLGMETMMNRTNGLALTAESEIRPYLEPAPILTEEPTDIIKNV